MVLHENTQNIICVEKQSAISGNQQCARKYIYARNTLQKDLDVLEVVSVSNSSSMQLIVCLFVLKPNVTFFLFSLMLLS